MNKIVTIFFIIICMSIQFLFARVSSNIDTAGYKEALLKCVDEKGNVDYELLKEYRPVLEKFIKAASEISKDEYASWYEKDKIAFLINVYNVQTLNFFLNYYPIQHNFVQSLFYDKNDVSYLASKYKLFKFKLLDDYKILKDLQQMLFSYDEKTIFCLYEGTISSPKLNNKPYDGGTLNLKMQNQVKEFLGDKNNFFIDTNTNIIYLSKIFDKNSKLFRKYIPNTKNIFLDFSKNELGVLGFVFQYLDTDEKFYLENGNYVLKYIKYDSRLR